MLQVVDHARFAVEKFADVIDQMKPLLDQHWAEIAVYPDIPLEPNYDFYKQADLVGLLRIYTVRQNGDIIGYSVFCVRPHVHYKNHSWAQNDVIWLHPDHRQQGIAQGLVRFWEDDLRLQGVSVVHVNAKTQHPALSFLLKSCGYNAVEVGFEKRLN